MCSGQARAATKPSLLHSQGPGASPVLSTSCPPDNTGMAPQGGHQQAWGKSLASGKWGRGRFRRGQEIPVTPRHSQELSSGRPPSPPLFLGLFGEIRLRVV